jgi:ferredoxin
MLEDQTRQLRSAARRLLEEDRVDCVIGYRQGTVPLRDKAFVAYTPEEADQLVWSSFCTNNLANFLIGRTDRCAIVAQGCVSRNVQGLVKENQIKRENVYILGIHSPGMVDHEKVKARFPDRIIHDVDEEGDEIVVKGADFEERILRRDVKRNNCYTCTHRNAIVYDEFIGEQGEQTGGGNIDKVAAPWEKLEPEERFHRFQETLKDCIRCYACRDICPLCYCSECFVDEARPQWCGKTVEQPDIYTFHLLRAFHCAGRCTDCGACESACPVGIKVRYLTSKIEKDMRELYDYQAFVDPDRDPPLSEYQPNDPEPFLKKK